MGGCGEKDGRKGPHAKAPSEGKSAAGGTTSRCPLSAGRTAAGGAGAGAVRLELRPLCLPSLEAMLLG
jgi:hypothetical protein